MNTYEAQHCSDYYDLHPSAVDLTIPSTGETCKGLFDFSFQGNDRDRAGVKKQTIQAHFTTYIGNSALFVDKRGLTVTIEGASYLIVNAELLQMQGAVSVWLA